MSQLIEINDRYYQEEEIVMLTTKYGKITLYDYDNLKTLSLAQGNHKGTKNTIRPQHLYILSNEEIKESDWVFHLDSKTIIKYDSDEKANNSYKKIIATTDKSIGYTDIRVSPVKNFCTYPQPSDSFIKKYVEEYNKGNIITKGLVEYEIGKSYSGNSGLEVKQWLKVYSNNTITIKTIYS